ncbi:phosphotransferase [Thermomonospora cellulosilytica]|uniref:Aminoglycoside phosphotransferase (APT) family kinase protein n=1 Tax=Thermomonospora cellulosilytica TaxID=1411118 RepID=A0A7W3R6M7_9ACTN|nr:phosphotransferase [Thermomonospora cellulosilytica]MBA9001619.1 aminoglycoside phosphotransferase (APT) family kinase protein [Thermomonospora cellulosilytica]
MAFEPRFHRVAALERRFVDREGPLAAVAEELARIGGGPRVLNLTGIGGIGKSRLLREIRDRVEQAGHRTAVLDLQVPALRQQADALAVLRVRLGQQGVRFDRYDIAYAVLWQRLHPHLRINERDLPFARESEVLSSAVDVASGVPVFATAVGLVRLLDRARAGQRRRRTLRIDAALKRLDELPNAELVDAVTYYFAEDLRDDSRERPYTIFIDAYEAMRGQDDTWLQDLVAQLDRGLTVIASREPVPWDGEWERVVRTVPIGGLPLEARLELLADGGIDDPRERRAIAAASEGVPFYLHLAVDTRSRGAGGVVSEAEILRRFLQHVDAAEIRFLELLSVARLFDFEVFRKLAAAFDLPGHRMAWESLTSYSFVYPAGPEHLQLHQLMTGALRERLSPEVQRDVHRVLRAIWDERGNLHEAAYHGLAAGDLTEAELLEYADEIKTSGGARGIGGLLADLRGRPDMADAARCLEAEQAILLGNIEQAGALTRGRPLTFGTPAGERLAVAAGHARRIAGDTAAALDIYTRTLEHASGGCRLDAGLWAADLHMAQGRFEHARRIVAEIRDDCGDRDAELRGDLARLLYLADRFCYDFDGARRHLDEATRWYAEARSVFGQSAVKTNEAELLAWTDPRAAIPAAVEAVEVQRELGALHELGKAYTALAQAQLLLGQLRESAASLELACDALERARYRSGRARAELLRAFLLARRGLPVKAAESARQAVAELQAVEVYPTLILVAARLLEVLGLPDPDVERAAGRARAVLGEAFDGVTAERADQLLGLRPGVLYEAAVRSPEAAAGFYNRNVRVGDLLVRAPIAGADGMDLKIWPENEVLAAIGPHLNDGTGGRVPRLLFASADPPYQIHEFVTGEVLDGVAPRGVRVPEHVVGDVADLFRLLAEVPSRELPVPPDGWPDDGDTVAFARRLSTVTGQVYETFRHDYAVEFRGLGIPAAPLAPVRWDSLTRRPFCLLHSDVHRKNMIVAQGRTVFLDWELALWGDPVYELAVHLHKMSYFDDERDALLARWQRAMPPDMTRAWREDLQTYLAHERVKSAIVDTVRYTQLVRSGTQSPEQDRHLLDKLTAKLNAAGTYWSWTRPIERAHVERVVRG